MISFNDPNKTLVLTDIRNQAESMSSQLSGFIRSKSESAIREAITNHLGTDEWTVEDAMPRLSMAINEFQGVHTIAMDGRPILYIDPFELVTGDVENSIYAKLSFRILSKPKVTDGD